jgi:hypothetical protein
MKYANPQKKRKMVEIIPNLSSRRVQKAAMKRIRTVTGMAAIVRPNSAPANPVTTTRNCTVKPRKKKKSNFNRAI